MLLCEHLTLLVLGWPLVLLHIMLLAIHWPPFYVC